MATKRLIRKYAVGSVVEERYELTSLLGAGGFATVFEARQVGVGRPVAIKMLDFFWDEEEDEKAVKAFEDRFLREAQVMASIRHPSVVTVFDYGIAQDTRQPFIVMELLTGHTFAEELANNGPMSAERLLPLLEPTLDALGTLHQQGTIHRDLKPGNWFLLSPGTAGEALRILDFGIAAIEEEEGRLTQTGEMVGTYHYMAPEYIVSKIATPALDVYQLGLLIVEMLAGRPVVQAESQFQCLNMHVQGMLDIPQELESGPLGPVLGQMLARDHERRYPTAAAVLDDLLGIDYTQVWSNDGSPPPQGRRRRTTSKVQRAARSAASQDRLATTSQPQDPASPAPAPASDTSPTAPNSSPPAPKPASAPVASLTPAPRPAPVVLPMTNPAPKAPKLRGSLVALALTVCALGLAAVAVALDQFVDAPMAEAVVGDDDKSDDTTAKPKPKTNQGAAKKCQPDACSKKGATWVCRDNKCTNVATERCPFVNLGSNDSPFIGFVADDEAAGKRMAGVFESVNEAGGLGEQGDLAWVGCVADGAEQATDAAKYLAGFNPRVTVAAGVEITKAVRAELKTELPLIASGAEPAEGIWTVGAGDAGVASALGQLITREEKPRRLIIASSQANNARNILEKLRPILEEARRPKAVVLVEYDPDDLPQERIDALVKSSLEEMPKPDLILFMGGPEIAKMVDGYKGNLPSRTRYLVHGGRKDDLRKIVQTVEYLKTWAPMRDKLTWTGVNAKLTPPQGVTALTTEEAAAWDAAWLAACAIVMTGDGEGKVDSARLTDGDRLVVGPKSWPTVRDTLAKGESVDLDGASGPLSLSAGVAMEDIGLWRVDRGDDDELEFLQVGVYTTGRKGPRWKLDD